MTSKFTDTHKKSAPGQRAKLSDCKPSKEQHSFGSFQTSLLRGIIPHRFEDSQRQIPRAAGQQSCDCSLNSVGCIEVLHSHNASICIKQIHYIKWHSETHTLSTGELKVTYSPSCYHQHQYCVWMFSQTLLSARREQS